MAKQDELTEQDQVPGPDTAPGQPAGGAHKHKTSSWITVVLLVLSSLAFGFALPMASLALAIVGAVLLLAGLILGFTGKIMDDVH